MGKDLKGKELGKGISQRADGRYIARFTSKTGKRKTLYDFKLNELKRKLREAVYEDEHGLNGNGESITLNAWYVTWTELYKKKTVKMTTIYKNHSYYNSRVKNSIGKMYLQDIKTYHVQKFLNDLIDSGLAHGTVSNIRFMLSDMFDKAVLSEYIRKNPCTGVWLWHRGIPGSVAADAQKTAVPVHSPHRYRSICWQFPVPCRCRISPEAQRSYTTVYRKNS